LPFPVQLAGVWAVLVAILVALSDHQKKLFFILAMQHLFFAGANIANAFLFLRKALKLKPPEQKKIADTSEET